MVRAGQRRSEAAVAEALLRRGWTLAVAESCTGGLLGAALTSRAGSSRYFLGGVIAYANAVKAGLLGVPAAALERHGAVSAPVAAAMARGAAAALGATIGVGITGVAGPGGGTRRKPVGLVYIAVARGRSATVRRYLFSGNRGNIRKSAVDDSIVLLEDCLNAWT